MQNRTRNLVIVALVALLVVVTCWTQSSGQGDPAKAPVTEYLVVPANKETLNSFAEKGWEVCAAFHKGSEANGTAIIRRPKTAK
jgi:hypothetical protein